MLCKKIIGIDPGLRGAICLLEFDRDSKNTIIKKRIISIHDMPTIKLKSFKSDALTRGKVNETALIDILKTLSKSADIAAIEHVTSMPQQGVASMFNFGFQYGLLTGALKASGLIVLKTPPSVWKSHFNLSRKKIDSVLRARAEFPQSKYYFKELKDDGRAEAALIALYGAQASFGLNC